MKSSLVPWKRGLVVGLIAIAGAWAAQTPVLSHHSNSAYFVEKVDTVTGVVKEWQWVNPHTWLYLTADDGKGGKVEWMLEGRAPGVLIRAGWSKRVLKPGDTVTVHYGPAKDGSKSGIIARVTLADGTVLANAGPGVQ